MNPPNNVGHLTVAGARWTVPACQPATAAFRNGMLGQQAEADEDEMAWFEDLAERT
jgi:hypothetical protein